MLDDSDVAKIAQLLRSGGGGFHPDAADDGAREAPDWAKVGEGLSILAGCVEELYDENEKLKAQLEELTSTVKDELIGGLSGLVDKRNRMGFVGSFKEEHPEFGRFEQIVRDLTGKDIYEEAGNQAYDYKNRPDYSDEGMASMLKEMMDTVNSRFGKYAGSNPEMKIEVTKATNAPEGVDSGLKAFLDGQKPKGVK